MLKSSVNITTQFKVVYIYYLEIAQTFKAIQVSQLQLSSVGILHRLRWACFYFSHGCLPQGFQDLCNFL